MSLVYAVQGQMLPVPIAVRPFPGNSFMEYGSSADLKKAPQRCGRPPVATYARHTWSISKPARERKQPIFLPEQQASSNSSSTPTASPSAPQACTDSKHSPPDLTYGLESWFDGSSFPSIGVAPHAYEQDWASALAGIDGLQQVPFSSPEPWEFFDTDLNYDDFENPNAEAETQAVSCVQRDEAAVTAADIKELADLHIGIHHIHVMVIEDTGPIPCDNITHVTRCFLNIINRVVGQTEQRLEINEPSFPLSPPPPLSTQPGLMVRSPSHRLHTEDKQPMLITPDTATVMMILACYQRLLDLFKQVCFILHKRTVTDDSDGSDASRYSGPHDITADPSDEDHLSYSVAQVAMITELVSHLLNQLDRGLRKLFGLLAPNSPILPAVSHVTEESAQVSSPGSQKHQASLHSINTTDAAEAGACEALLGSMNVVKAMHQTHRSLESYIHMIKESVRTSRNI